MRTNFRGLTPAFAALCSAFAATGSNAADIFALKSTTFEGAWQADAEEGRQQQSQPAEQSELRRR